VSCLAWPCLLLFWVKVKVRVRARVRGRVRVSSTISCPVVFPFLTYMYIYNNLLYIYIFVVDLMYNNLLYIYIVDLIRKRATEKQVFLFCFVGRSFRLFLLGDRSFAFDPFYSLSCLVVSCCVVSCLALPCLYRSFTTNEADRHHQNHLVRLSCGLVLSSPGLIFVLFCIASCLPLPLSLSVYMSMSTCMSLSLSF
jgi:hypothetical protein